MRIFILWVLIILFSTYGAMAFEYKPRWAELPCKICIERYEEQGILNVRLSRIVIDDKQALDLIGGQAACAFVLPGEHFIYAESYDPYDLSSKDPKAWSSNKINFALEKGKMAEFEVRKSLRGKEDQWQINRVK